MSGRYALFLGCVAPLRYPGIELATREVFKSLNVELVDLQGAGCCPAPGVIRSFDQNTWLALGARNLALAEKQGVDLMTICNGCFGSLFEANHVLQHHPEKLKEVNEILGNVGMHYSGNVKVRHFAEVLYNDIGMEKIKSKVTKPLSYNIAVHYGCHFIKPTRLKHLDDAERPRILDELVEATGAKSLNYRDKLMCCGAGGGVRSRASGTALKMTEEKLKNVKKVGAQMILDVCPFCHLQYDRSQKDLPGYDIPVIHLSQLYGMAFGLPREKLGLEAHETKVNIWGNPVYSAQLVGVYNYGEMPEELSGFVYFQAARENRKARRGDKVAVLVIEGTTSYVVVFLDTLRSVDELETRLAEQDAKLTQVSKGSLERVLKEMPYQA